MNYKTTRQADQDIIGLYGRGAEDFGLAQAERYVEGLFSCFLRLAANPHLARERSELDPPMRLHPYGSHLIAYTITDDAILIVRVLHGRQDWLKLFS